VVPCEKFCQVSICTESPASHRSRFSGEIARFRIGHRCVNLVLVIGDCAFQLCTTGKHVFRFRALPSGIAVDGRERRTTGEHPTHVSDIFCVEVLQVDLRQRRATREHAPHVSDIFCVEILQIDRRQRRAIIEHPTHVSDVFCVEVLQVERSQRGTI